MTTSWRCKCSQCSIFSVMTSCDLMGSSRFSASFPLFVYVKPQLAGNYVLIGNIAFALKPLFGFSVGFFRKWLFLD